uniref:Alpha-mannosidase n=1 Tax=Strongyloides venezuelensis TaxID=75913 RepID=A0A0K0FV29_STRVS
MLKVYSNISFEQYSTIANKNYYDVNYDTNNKNDMRKINVFLIPHSHDDPGWLKTFEKYYEDDVSKILNGMLEYLSEDNNMRFVYVEMSFFELFYSTLPGVKRQKIKKLLSDKKLEIITGGWVMSDEANSHFFSQITELFEGHEFLRNNLQYIPTNHWSIDPFGLSPTMAYLAKECGFKHMAIQRVHYLVKQYFAQRKLFEFQWRQLWSGGYKDQSSSTDIFTHIFPFGSYTSSETCGPDKNKCNKIDFSKVSNKISNDYILGENIKIVVDQFRKKSLLFRGSNIFVPIGTDFSYSKKEEWGNVYDNYKMIIEKINKSPEFNMNIQFGTLEDYFKANDKTLIEENVHIPVITGDFFTYADRNEEYWSGYYTSRPFYKRFDRVLMDTLRSAEIIFSSVLGKTKENEMSEFLKLIDYNKLVYARRALSLFQHHDGVTGTAKDHVVLDYGKKLFKAIQNCYSIIEKSIQYDIRTKIFDKLDISMLSKINNEKDMIKIKSINVDNNILLFNPHSQDFEKELLCTNVDGQKIYIIENIDIDDQEIHPIVEKENNELKISEKSYKLCYVTSLKAFDVKIHKLVKFDGLNVKPRIAKIFTLLNNFKTTEIFKNYEKLETNDNENFFTVSELHGLKINKKTGYVEAINNSPVSINFEYYMETTNKPNSGAYLFTPEGPSKVLNYSNNTYIISKGNLRQEVVVVGPLGGKIFHSIESKAISPHYIDINNIIDLNSEGEIEIAMKLKTNNNGKIDMIKNKNVFFTDLNGYQIIKRRRLDKLPIQGNFYPMPSIIFIEDDIKRLTVLGNQPLGCSSQEEGSVEVMLDRRHFIDDHRGLDQGIIDNIPTRSRFRILMENKYNSSVSSNNDDLSVTGYLSSSASQENQKLQYNIIQMEIDKKMIGDDYKLSILKKELPPNINIVTLRSLTAPENYGRGGEPDNEYNRVRRIPLRNAAMILQNVAYDGSVGEKLVKPYDVENTKLNMADYFNDNFIHKYQEASLTLLYESKNYTLNGFVEIKPMELKTLKVSFL